MAGMALATLLSRWPLRFLPSQLANVSPPTMAPAVFAVALVCAIGLALASSALPLLRLRKLRINDALAGR